MGLTKSQEFTEVQNDLARYAKALGHPARIAILQHLISCKSCVCGDIVDELPLSQSTVSQHLQELKQAGLIQGTIEGPSICYCIEPTAWLRMKDSLGVFFESYKEANCC